MLAITSFLPPSPHLSKSLQYKKTLPLSSPRFGGNEGGGETSDVSHLFGGNERIVNDLRLSLGATFIKRIWHKLA